MNVKLVETEKELNDAYTIRKIVFVEEQNVPLEEEINQFEDAASHFILYQEDTPIGAGRFRAVDGYGKVERICILKTARKSGAGSLLMNEIEHFAVQKGFKKLKLNAQTQAIPFYTNLGYTVVSDEFLDAGIPHKTMIKEL